MRRNVRAAVDNLLLSNVHHACNVLSAIRLNRAFETRGEALGTGETTMQKCVFGIALVGHLLLFAPGTAAQDYRGRVQGSILDSTQAGLPGTTVTMVNDATGVAVTFVADKDGHYVFDFVITIPASTRLPVSSKGSRRPSSGTSASRSAAVSRQISH